MSDSKYIQKNIVDDVVIITFNRLEHNVMNISMIIEINNELKKILANDSLKALVLKANGKSWCAGVEVSDHKPKVVNKMINLFGKMFYFLHELEIPIISAVHGSCLGGGMELAIASDIIVATESAVFGQPEVKLGFLPPYAVVKLVDIIGISRAVEICTTGRRYSAKEVYNFGMISKIISGSDKTDILDDLNIDILKEIRECSPLTIRLNKKAIMDFYRIEINKRFSYVNSFFLNTLMKTKDVLEGISSFEERRKPQWLNK